MDSFPIIKGGFRAGEVCPLGLQVSAWGNLCVLVGACMSGMSPWKVEILDLSEASPSHACSTLQTMFVCLRPPRDFLLDCAGDATQLIPNPLLRFLTQSLINTLKQPGEADGQLFPVDLDFCGNRKQTYRQTDTAAIDGHQSPLF
jgi:hypothetical protein